MGKLDGKVALITGAARGIGKQIALTFASEGADIAICDLIDMTVTAAEVENLGRRAVTVRTDVTKKDDIKRAFDAAIEQLGKVDVMVNNAAIRRQAPFLDLSEEDWDAVMDVNLKGAFLCSQIAGKHMIERQYGKIINMASSAGLMASKPNSAFNYQCSKAGVIRLTRACAQALGPHGINVNGIAPGQIMTEGTFTKVPQRSREEVQRIIDVAKKNTPLGRWGTPEEVAKLAVFLASDDSSYITGQVITIDGGWI